MPNLSLVSPNKSKKWLLLLVIILIAVGGVWKWQATKANQKKEESKRERITSVKVEKVVREDVPVYLEGLGTVQAYNTVVVHSQVQGQLQEVLFREGEDVQKGDVLAKIDPRTYQAQLDQALASKARDAAQLENARRDLARYIQLGTMISAQTVDTQRSTVAQLEAALQADQAAINSAQTLLSYTVITAPINGRTGLRQVDVGNIIQPGTGNGLVVITQLEPISVLFSLPSNTLTSLNREIARQGSLELAALDGQAGTVLDVGILELVDNQIDPNTGTIRLKATFPNKKRLLWPGGFVNVQLLLTTRTNSLVVPAIAVQQGPKGSYVFVLGKDNTAMIHPVKIGITSKTEAVIEEGVEEGELVITEGAANLSEGKKVTVINDKPPL